jgi:hypothetical protein
MRTRKVFRAFVTLSAVSLLAACTYGAGPIEQMATQNMAICNATHDQRACDQWTYAAPLVQGERDRQQFENSQKADGVAAGMLGAALLGIGLSH